MGITLTPRDTVPCSSDEEAAQATMRLLGGGLG